MKFKKLGNTNIDVSLICLGTMNMGEQNTEAEGFEQMDYALDQGVNFFDTAEVYSVPPREETQGKTEEIIGNWFAKTKKRDKIILATKMVGPGPSWIRGGGGNFTEKNMALAIEGSLKRLQTDYIDLYQLHWPERNTNFFGKRDYAHSDNEQKWNDIESVLNGLKKFVDQGKIRYVGLSNETPWGFSKFLEIAERNKLPRVVSVQNPYNLLNRAYDIGMSEISCREKAGLLAYSPLAIGYLSGKYMNNQLPEKSRVALYNDFWVRYREENAKKAVVSYFNLAKKNGLSLTQLALAFVNSRPFVTSNIIGATTMEQLKENIGSVNINLDEKIIEEINLIHAGNPNPTP
ncbi:MAG: aldo/keto reductase [Pelagibacteraceae bacterium]|jgi:aryl-alcohol dehydrogenase-like predicted oxidoreductase